MCVKFQSRRMIALGACNGRLNEKIVLSRVGSKFSVLSIRTEMNLEAQMFKTCSVVVSYYTLIIGF